MIDYYYEQLNFTERRIYKSIYVSIVNKESYVYIAHIKKENLEKIYIGISYDHPEIYYVDFSTVNYEIDSCRIRLIFEYLFSRGILAIIENKTNQEIERIVSAMSSNSGKGIIQIEKSIHDYMVNSISYDYEALRNKSMNRCSFNIYGVINNRLAVCEGIAKFVKLTLNKLGIECFICGGKELLVINIGNIANELYVNVLIEELKRAIAYGSSAAVVLDSISIVGNDKLKELIMGLSGQVRFTVIGDDVVALSGSDEQLFTRFYLSNMIWQLEVC